MRISKLIYLLSSSYSPFLFCTPTQTVVLIMVAFAALSPTLGASIYNPAFEQLREQLGATDTELSLSVSLFILFQGGWPICEYA
jgi:hypothetical protein